MSSSDKIINIEKPAEKPKVDPNVVLLPVPVAKLDAALPEVAGLIGQCVARDDYNDYDSIVAALKSGQKQLWIAADKYTGVLAVIVTQIDVAVKGKILRVVYLTGSFRKRWLPLRAMLYQWGKEQGCTKFKAWTREGWGSELPELRKTHILLEMDL